MLIKIHLILGVFGVYSSFFEKKSSKVTNSSCDNMNLQYSERKPQQLLYTSEYMKDYIFELWGNNEDMIDHCTYAHSLSRRWCLVSSGKCQIYFS